MTASVATGLSGPRRSTWRARSYASIRNQGSNPPPREPRRRPPAYIEERRNAEEEAREDVARGDAEAEGVAQI